MQQQNTYWVNLVTVQDAENTTPTLTISHVNTDLGTREGKLYYQSLISCPRGV